MDIVQEFDRWQVRPPQINEKQPSSPCGVGLMDDVRSLKINLKKAIASGVGESCCHRQSFIPLKNSYWEPGSKGRTICVASQFKEKN